MTDTRRTGNWFALLAGLLLLGWTYREVFASLVGKWYDDAAYSHGFLILPIVAWLVWRERRRLAGVPLAPSWWGLVALLPCVLAWIVAHGAGVRVIEQFAAVAMVPALVLTVLGPRATGILAFPLAFLFFAVPFGRGIVPVLMQFTADLATFGLQLTGVPVLRSYMHISIPAGNFEVARACSGLNYFVTALVLGVLYAYLTYRSWTKRILCVAAFIVIPVLLNGLRVYFTILVSHWTDMRFGPGTEHVTFGRIFFVAMMLLIFWIGRRWADDEVEPATPAASRVAGARGGLGAILPVAAALVVLALGPLLLQSSVASARDAIGDGSGLAAIPSPAPGWQLDRSAGGRWAPDYAGGLVRKQAVFRDARGVPVDAFVAVYGLGQTMGDEMIKFGNVIDDSEHGSLLSDRRVAVELGDGRTLPVRELSINTGYEALLVWQWFAVGERPVVSPFAAKALEAAAFVTRNASSERIVTLATPDAPDARARLQEFVAAHGACVAAGFSGEACGG